MPDSRKDAILDAAQQLFCRQGYQVTTIEDILGATGIARGTLYYHFDGKEALLRAIVLRTTAQIQTAANAVLASDADPVAKVLGILGAARVEGADSELIEEFHAAGNAEFHLLSLVEGVRALTPILTAAVEEGVAAGVFATGQPRDDVEILLTAGFMLQDGGVFADDAARQQERMLGLISAAERLLGCHLGTFADMLGGAR